MKKRASGGARGARGEKVVSSRRRALLSRSAFTLIEMLTTVAALIIVLGLMVSLARYVRDRSAQQLTRETLRELETLMAQYVDHNGGKLPAVDPILSAELGAAAFA